MSELPPSDAPWAMQLAARVEKVDPPTTVEICAAAALAVVGLLDDERACADGPWAKAIESWRGGGRIRKLVRRGRASAWQRAQEPQGHTAVHGRAEVRAYVPSPMDQVPDPVAKLQIKSTDLDEPPRTTSLPAAAGTGVGSRGPGGILIAVTPAVEMSWGKQAAQCAHAAQLLWTDAEHDRRAAWTKADRPITIVHPEPGLWAELLTRSTIQVHDGGFTEIPAGTLTTVALWSD